MDIGLIAAGTSLVVSSLALLRAYQPTLALKRLTKAFEALEDEWEETRESLKSTLGRVSRLKRDIMPALLQREEAGATGEDSPAVGGNGLTHRQAAKQQEILERRQRGLLRR